jgi:hypothetical protein
VTFLLLDLPLRPNRHVEHMIAASMVSKPEVDDFPLRDCKLSQLGLMSCPL